MNPSTKYLTRYRFAFLMTLASVRYVQHAHCATDNSVSIFFKNVRHKNFRPFYRRPIYFQYYAYFFKNSTLLKFKNPALLKIFFKRSREKPLLIYWGSAVCVSFGIGLFFIHQKNQPSDSLPLICSNGKKEKAENKEAAREKAPRQKAENKEAAREKVENKEAVREKSPRQKAENKEAAREKAENKEAEKKKIMQLLLECLSKHPGYIWAFFSTDLEFIKDICQWGFESHTEEENNKKHAHLIKESVFQEFDAHSNTIIEARYNFYKEALKPVSHKILHLTLYSDQASIQIRKANRGFSLIKDCCFRDFELLLLLGECLSEFSKTEGEFFYKALIEKTDKEQRTIRGEGGDLADRALQWPAAFCLNALIRHSTVIKTMQTSKSIDYFIGQIERYQEKQKTKSEAFKSELEKNPSGEAAGICTQQIEFIKKGLEVSQKFLFILKQPIEYRA